jgi:hypothetical protein
MSESFVFLQMQYCRVEGQDKCVMGMTVEMDGIPYADTFSVEVRWVARREGAKDIIVQVGVFVNFKKNTFLKSKIRAGTIEETTSVHESLFACAKKVCIAAGGEELPAAEEKQLQDREAPAEEEKPASSFPLNKYMIAVVILSALYLFYCLLRPSETVEPVMSPDIVYLGRRIDKLEADNLLLQQTLGEVLALLKEQRGNQS